MLHLDLQKIDNNSYTLSIDDVGYTQEANTYYLAIDKGLMPGIDSTNKVLSVLHRLINNWIDVIESILEDKSSNRLTYLPFDFSDEYLGCLRVELLSEGVLKIDYGYTYGIVGYTISPSKAIFLNDDRIKDYEQFSKSFKCEPDKLVSELKSICFSIKSYIMQMKP
jgi:hypothetical protein